MQTQKPHHQKEMVFLEGFGEHSTTTFRVHPSEAEEIVIMDGDGDGD
jgi:hypothetical protein